MRTVRRARNEEAGDLDLAPMLAMIVSLIPILLLSFSFYQTAVIETSVASPLASAPQKKKTKKLRVVLEIKDNRHMKLIVKKKKRVVAQRKIASQEGRLNFEKLKKLAKEFRRQYPDVQRVEMAPSQGLSYQEIIEAVDHLKAQDESGDLYRHVVFANLFKG